MADACRELFDYAARFVAADDVAAYAPGDPGYPDYVRTFNEILATGAPPTQSNFEVTETIGLTRWADAGREEDPPRFRRFRTLTSAVGISLCVTGALADDDMPSNYLAITLIEDAHELRDGVLLSLLGPAFGALREPLSRQRSGELPFVSLGRLLVATELGATEAEASTMAVQVAVEAATVRCRDPGEFLWDCNCFDELRQNWAWHVARVLADSPVGPASLRDALLAGPPLTRKPPWPS